MASSTCTQKYHVSSACCKNDALVIGLQNAHQRGGTIILLETIAYRVVPCIILTSLHTLANEVCRPAVRTAVRNMPMQVIMRSQLAVQCPHLSGTLGPSPLNMLTPRASRARNFLSACIDEPSSSSLQACCWMDNTIMSQMFMISTRRKACY